MSDDLDALRHQIESQLKDLQPRLTRAHLAEALAPFGIEIEADLARPRVLRLRIDTDDAGWAVVIADRASVRVKDTRWIHLPEPLDITLPRSASSARMFEMINERLLARLRPRAVPARRRSKDKHRDLLCTNGVTAGRFTVTQHVLISTGAKGDVWRCDDCHFNTTVPHAP